MDSGFKRPSLQPATRTEYGSSHQKQRQAILGQNQSNISKPCNPLPLRPPEQDGFNTDDPHANREGKRHCFVSQVVNSHKIAATISQLAVPGEVGDLLVYDPAQDAFLLYSCAVFPNPYLQASPCERCVSELPLLVQGLVEARPTRFQSNSSVFQLFFTNSDFSYTQNSSNLSSVDQLSPRLHFGSFFRNTSILPTILGMPHSEYLRCVLEWRSLQGLGSDTEGECRKWALPFRDDLNWTNLISKIIWRGSDFQFLPSVNQDVFVDNYSVPHFPFWPRQVAVKMSSEMPQWFDAKLTRLHGLNRIDLRELSTYRYHIDIGGAGGTSWRGTLEKLAMPGLLFHHETPSQDWFYEELIPWHHYVPVRTDLSDLRERFEWAESHQVEAQAIARRGTEFVRHLFSYKRLKQEYRRYFGDLSVLYDLIQSYQPTTSNETVDSILFQYQSVYNIAFAPVAKCTREYCDIRNTLRLTSRFFWRNSTCEIVASTKRRTKVGSKCAW